MISSIRKVKDRIVVNDCLSLKIEGEYVNIDFDETIITEGEAEELAMYVIDEAVKNSIEVIEEGDKSVTE